LRLPVTSYLQIPVTAMMQRGGVQQVAVVDQNSTIKFRPIKVASTNGAVINVSDGLQAGERVGLNVSTDLIDGAKVRASNAAR